MKLVAKKPNDTPEKRYDLACQLMVLIEGERAKSLVGQVPYTIGNDPYAWVLDAHNDWTLLFDEENPTALQINHRDSSEKADAFCRWVSFRLPQLQYDSVRLAVSEACVYNTPNYKPVVENLPKLNMLEQGSKNGKLYLLECVLKTTGERVAAIVATASIGENVQFTPIGIMLNGDPFNLLESPFELNIPNV
jgi:hypothetical protein